MSMKLINIRMDEDLKKKITFSVSIAPFYSAENIGALQKMK